MKSDVAIPKRKRGRPRREDIASIDARVLDAGLMIFRTVGFDAAQMEGIAAAAGITKASLYRRFENKADLLCAVVVALADDLALVALSVEDAGDALDRLQGLMRLYRHRAIQPDQVALHRLVVAALPSQPSIGGALDKLRRNLIEPVDRLIDQAVVEGLIEPRPTPRLREAMFDLLVNSATAQALMNLQIEVDQDDAFDFAWSILMRGVRSSKSER